MRTPFRLLLLVSLFASAALLAPATPGGAASDAVITVNTPVDEYINDGNCSLREAIRATNTNSSVGGCPAGSSGTDTIMLPEGFYQLSIAGVEEEFAMTGDLDINGNLIIQGVGQELTIIDGGYINSTTYIDRVFHITGPHTVQIKNLTIQHGYASAGSLMLGGGGILNQGTLTLRDISMNDNRAVNVGGAMDNYIGMATLYNSSIRNNYSTKDGGGIFNNGQLFLYDSTLSGNIATSGGGGLDNRGSATIQNVTISGNSASAGGGLFNDGELFILYSSLVANTATANPSIKGGNIENAGSIRMKTTIVANSLVGPNCAGGGTIVSEGHNLEDTDTCTFIEVTDLPNTDPVIGSLADNEGPTMTHALLQDSPAIDSADDLDCPDKDQRGAFRPADGDGVNGAVCDIGAFEFAGKFPVFVFVPLVMH